MRSTTAKLLVLLVRLGALPIDGALLLLSQPSPAQLRRCGAPLAPSSCRDVQCEVVKRCVCSIEAGEATFYSVIEVTVRRKRRSSESVLQASIGVGDNRVRLLGLRWC